MGFALPHKSPYVRWSLTPPFHPYQLLGGIFSVALSRRSLWVGITHHCTLWSPDFPQSKLRSSDSLVRVSIALKSSFPKRRRSAHLLQRRTFRANDTYQQVGTWIATEAIAPSLFALEVAEVCFRRDCLIRIWETFKIFSANLIQNRHCNSGNSCFY